MLAYKLSPPNGNVANSKGKLNWLWVDDMINSVNLSSQGLGSCLDESSAVAVMITEHKKDSWKLIDERLLWQCRFDLTVGNTLLEEIVASEGDGRFIIASIHG